MSSAVVNEAEESSSKYQPADLSEKQEDEEYSSKSVEINEDYTSFKIIEMLKHDRFMNSIDKLNDFFPFPNKKNKNHEQIEGTANYEKLPLCEHNGAVGNSEQFSDINLITDNVDLPKYDETKDYYLEYWKTFIDIKLAREELMQWSDRRNEKIKEVLKIMKYYDSNYEDLKENRPNGRKKHNRRTAKEIEKEYKCPYKCGKFYGSEGSLNLHMKLKHAGGNKTEREKAAKALVIAQFRGEKLPEIFLNLPAGAIDEAAKELNIRFDSKILKELQNSAKVKFEQYLEKCKKDNNIDPLTNMPYVTS